MYCFAVKKIDPTATAVIGMTLVLVAVGWHQTHPPSQASNFISASHKACTGLPIVVSYPYKGVPENPHECIVQCQDQKEHYILYSNGMGTQCDTLPNCNDRGEDDGVTCDPPNQDSTAS